MIDLYYESSKIRRIIDDNVGNDSLLFVDSFPINACKQASLLCCYHLQKLGFDKPLKCIFGISKKRVDDVGHWWIETEGKIIDLTADQFNTIDDSELSYKIKVRRPYKPVYCCSISEAPHHKVFQEHGEFIYDFDELADEFIDILVRTYEYLLSLPEGVESPLTCVVE